MPSPQEVLAKISGEYTVIFPAVDVDSLIAAGMLLYYSSLTNTDASITLDLKNILEIEKSTQKILIGFNNISNEEIEQYNLLVLEPPTNSSLSASIARITSSSTVGSTWLYKLGILAGEYRGLDLGKNGFKGLEKHFVDELAERGEIEPDFGFRLWGWSRRRLLEMLTRTFYPLIPGITGNIDNTRALLKSVPNIIDPETATSHDIFSETDPEKAKVFVQKLYDAMQAPEEIKKTILYKLIGMVYLINIDNTRIDSPELLGTLITYMTLKPHNPLDIPHLVLDHKHLFHLLAIYNDYVDVVAAELSMIINQKEYAGPIETDYISRPETISDVLSYIGMTPSQPITIHNLEYGEYTCARELLRTGSSLMDVVDKCDEYQLCKTGR